VRGLAVVGLISLTRPISCACAVLYTNSLAARWIAGISTRSALDLITTSSPLCALMHSRLNLDLDLVSISSPFHLSVISASSLLTL
jgi:hypothetical protein